MVAGLQKYFPKAVKYTNPEGGMFLWVTVPGVDDTVAFVPGDPFFAGKPQPGTFRLNYSNMAEDKITAGLKQLGAALDEALNK